MPLHINKVWCQQHFLLSSSDYILVANLITTNLPGKSFSSGLDHAFLHNWVILRIIFVQSFSLFLQYNESQVHVLFPISGTYSLWWIPLLQKEINSRYEDQRAYIIWQVKWFICHEHDVWIYQCHKFHGGKILGNSHFCDSLSGVNFSTWRKYQPDKITTLMKLFLFSKWS